MRLSTDNTSMQARLALVHGVLLRRVGEHVYDFLTRSLFWAGLRSRKRRGRGVFTERAVLSVPKVTTENDHDARASPRLVNSLVCLRQSTSHQYNVEGVSIREALGRLAVTQGCMSVHIHSWRFESTNDRSRQQALVLGISCPEKLAPCFIRHFCHGFPLCRDWSPRCMTGQTSGTGKSGQPCLRG